ncbi:hypothetical protein PV327_011294, partial [Microctonus hyperodae]
YIMSIENNNEEEEYDEVTALRIESCVHQQEMQFAQHQLQIFKKYIQSVNGLNHTDELPAELLIELNSSYNESQCCGDQGRRIVICNSSQQFDNLLPPSSSSLPPPSQSSSQQLFGIPRPP